MQQKIQIFFLGVLLFSFQSYANIVGTDFHNFNPTSNGLDFVTVHSSDTLEAGQINLGSFLTYSTNSLPYFTVAGAPTNRSFAEPNDSVFAADFHFGLGLTQGWDIGVSATNIFSQDIENSTFLGTFSQQGVTDVRVNTKVRLYKGESSGLAVLASVDKERVANNPYSGIDPGLTYNIELAFDTFLGEGWRWGINGGYRLRDSGAAIAGTQITPMSDQILYSSALSYDIASMASHVFLEIFGSSPTQSYSTPTDRELSNLQGLLGWRWRAHQSFDIHFGGGSELYQGLGTPDVLLYAGFNWRPGKLWNNTKDTDEDGVEDSQDQCPQTRPADRKIVNANGCADTDKDGVHNGIDQCPNTPEKYRQSVDATGCHSDDLDGDGVPNDMDRCPDTPAGEKVNNLGCAIKRMTEIRLENLNFLIGKAKLQQSSIPKLKDAVAQLTTIKDQIELIIVEGHTDSTGGDSMNLELSLKRAGTVRTYLLEKLKMQDHEIESKGFGEAQPIANNGTKAGRMKNRRVEIRVIRSR